MLIDYILIDRRIYFDAYFDSRKNYFNIFRAEFERISGNEWNNIWLEEKHYPCVWHFDNQTTKQDIASILRVI